MKIRKLDWDVENRELEVVAALMPCLDNFWSKKIDHIQLATIAKKFGTTAEFIIAEDGELGCLGCAAYYRNNQETKIAFLSIIVTRKGFESKGIGTSLLDAVERDCALNGFVSIQLEVATENVAAIKFYKKRKYQLMGCGKQGYLSYSKSLQE